MRGDNYNNEEDGQVVRDGWLIKSREPLMKLPLFRSKWVRRYCVLRSGSLPNQCRLDQYDERRRKRTKALNLDECTRVDSYLRLTHTNDQKEWIFAMHIKKRELYLAAESEEEMNAWVRDLCTVCNLEREEHSDEHIEFEDPGVTNLAPSISHDSILDTPNTEISNINSLFATAANRASAENELNEEQEEESHLYPLNFPPVDHNRSPDASSALRDNYLHIAHFNSRHPATPTAEDEQEFGAQAKNGYVLLAKCVSAQPRPHKERSISEGAGSRGGEQQRRMSEDSDVSSSHSISLSDTDSNTNCPTTTEPSFTNKLPSNLDSVLPPPRPPKGGGESGRSGGHWYSNEEETPKLPPGYSAPGSARNQFLNQKPPPPPIPSPDQEGSSAETIKPTSEDDGAIVEDENKFYLNFSLAEGESKTNEEPSGGSTSPAPLVDRSTKPGRSHNNQTTVAKSTTVRINRLDSFVKKNSQNYSSVAPQQDRIMGESKARTMPAMLPKTSPRNRMTPKQLERIAQSPSSSLGGSATLGSPRTPMGNVHQQEMVAGSGQLQYLDPSFAMRCPQQQAPSPSMYHPRSPSPRAMSVDSPTPLSKESTPAKANYLVIDPKRTKALEETIVEQQVSRTLERHDRNKH